MSADRELQAGIVQDSRTGQVLMLGWLDQTALEATRQSGLAHFWSRSRQQLWKKGESSGHTLRVLEMTTDCDGDAWLIRAAPAGPTCHTGTRSCFGDEELAGFAALERLDAVIADRFQARPPGSYTTSLLDGGVDAVGRKVVEEATEVLLAAKDHALGSGSSSRVSEEAADLIYHLLVLLRERSIPARTVIEELVRRSEGAGQGRDLE